MKHSLVFSIAILLGGCARHASLRSPHVDAAAELTSKTVALVATDEDDGSTRAYCTGVWVSQNEILTAAHCVERDPFAALLGSDPGIRYVVKGDVFVDGGDIEIKYPTTRSATVARFDAVHDLALLRVEAAPEHATAVLSKADAIAQGSFAQSMGHARGFWWSYSSGDVAAVRLAPLGTEPIWWVQATTPISPGNSGGGLFDGEGKLIGICSRGVGGRAQNLNFFVHRDHVAAFLGGKS